MAQCEPLSSGAESNTTVEYYRAAKYIALVATAYQPYHPVVALTLIGAGVSLGGINIIILNLRQMVSPTNRILSAIGLADLVTMGVYAPYVAYFHIHDRCALFTGTPSQAPATFLYVCVVLMAISHCASIWFAIGLSGLRLHVMRHPQQVASTTWRQMTVIVACVVGAACASSYVYVINTVVERRNISYVLRGEGRDDAGASEKGDERVVVVRASNFIVDQTGSGIILFHGIMVKLVPAALLTVLVAAIVHQLHRYRRHRSRSLGKMTSGSGAGAHTTRMLIGVVLLFIALELPQGIFILISAGNAKFYREIYNGLGDIIDLMTIIRTVANFFIYCAMSATFRQCLLNLCCRSCGGWRGVGAAVGGAATVGACGDARRSTLHCGGDSSPNHARGHNIDTESADGITLIPAAVVAPGAPDARTRSHSRS